MHLWNQQNRRKTGLDGLTPLREGLNNDSLFSSLVRSRGRTAEVWTIAAAVAEGGGGGGEHDWVFDVEYFRKGTMEE